MRKFLNALLYKKLISGEMQLTGEKCKPSKMQTFSKGTTLHKYYCTIIGVWSESLFLWFFDRV